MILFWSIGAALALGVLAWLLRPLLRRNAGGVVLRSTANVAIYRDQLRELASDLAAGTLAREDYERARAELERRLLDDVERPDEAVVNRRAWGTAAAVALVVPIMAVALYLLVGAPVALTQESQLQASSDQLDSMVARLAAHLRENPDDVQGWKLLGRSLAALGRHPEAAGAYARAAVHAPRDAELLTDLAEALALARGRKLDGEPEKLLQRALEIEPDNVKALALSGSAAFERADYAAAAAYWERLLPLVSPADARSVQQSVAEAQSLAREKKDAKKDPGKAITGTVSISPKLKDKAAPDDVVFVFARAAEGPPMPLAVARTRVRDLPYKFRLDDSMAMAPALKLSGFPKVVVTARVSKSGTAAAQPGDLQGASKPVANDAGSVNVVIDSLVPDKR
jgi:cytochrome c-type biogenesis protein CcmH